MEHLLVNQELLNKQLDLLQKHMDKKHMSNKELELYDGLIELLCTLTETRRRSIEIRIE